eukprot:7382789-Prymnesium_polylepis.1
MAASEAVGASESDEELERALERELEGGDGPSGGGGMSLEDIQRQLMRDGSEDEGGDGGGDGGGGSGGGGGSSGGGGGSSSGGD